MTKTCSNLAIGLLLTSMVLASCTKDDSSVAGQLIPGITIEPLTEDNAFNVVSFQGNRLEVRPVVYTEYPDGDLSFDWYLIDNAAEPLTTYNDGEPVTFDRTHIATGRQLTYEVNLTPGQYTLILEVKAPNGYTVSQKATLNAVTNFSQGFYILKETADGRTELDLLNTSGNVFLQNVMTSVYGAPIDGRPLCLSTARSHCYIDTVTNTTASANLVTVTTQDGQLYGMRTSDLRRVFSRQSLLFTDMDDDEVPYRIVSGMWGNYLVSSRGVRFQYDTSMQGLADSGKYGLESEMGASPYVAYDDASSSIFFWDDESHSVGISDYNGSTTVAQDDRYKLSGLSRMTCVAAGYNAPTGYVVFVLSSLDGSQRQLVLISPSFSGGIEVKEMRALRVNKVNTARLFTVSCTSAALLYGIVGNTVYGLDLTTFAEQEITPKGIGQDEQIVYFSNQSGGSFGTHDYLVVGTKKQDDEGYTLRFYNQLGGLPDGEPVYTLHGTGTPRAIHYTEQQAYAFSTTPLQD